ncbi:unnamed protein product [Durusdinium trenchii]|uniref:Uncharacterized protein n=1 Tax=Durusdinium trenchii TaxID=1381693 RepID=A0ABP0NVK7_9DINO
MMCPLCLGLLLEPRSHRTCARHQNAPSRTPSRTRHSAMAASPDSFLQSFEAQTTQQWDAKRALHAEILRRLSERDLPGVMNLHSPGEEENLKILDLRPAPCSTDSADLIRRDGEAAVACAAECEFFGLSALETVGSVVELCNEELYANLRTLLTEEFGTEASVVENTKAAIAQVQDKSIRQALLQSFSEEAVNEMYTCDTSAHEYDKMQSNLHQLHVQGTKDAATRLLRRSKLPPLHDTVHAKLSVAEALQRKADLAVSKHDAAEALCARLEEHQADVRGKKQRCASLRRVTLREEAVKRQELEEAEKAHQRAWEEYQKAFIRDEAVVILEEDLVTADEVATGALRAAKVAYQEATPKFERCAAEAARCRAALSAISQESHARLLVESKPTVEEAWKNTAFASELGKCVLAAKRREIGHLCKEQQQSQERAQRQKQPKSKAQTLEKVEQLEGQILRTREEVAELERLVSGAEEQFDSFRVLNSGLDEEAIRRFAQEKAAACYGDFELFVDESDGAELADADPEKFKIEKQQMLAEFQLLGMTELKDRIEWILYMSKDAV